MPSEVIRCTDCGAAFKGVPAWLSTAKVKFTCTNCPKRPSRALARFDSPAAPLLLDKDDDKGLDKDADLEAVELDDLDDEADLELPADEDDAKDDKDI